ncbi:MAG: protein-glutamate O-methyltransferase CheR [Magnetococcales bacterium]|nr:protein-glutamate O-methyltransferase CheR [Magnetococcales bacterium]MBF0149430.1 protein-glutamate O-methyltransferase CheR [Magnetococcales bacterium]MBF0171918.1 protein-glutamate O-methyltransferase CheR [Magnetococcales bacterium]MBF0347219.1 protein-glutamate O-methyltransferase CheR [Magnetococcales bacterium]MBF0630493.1 protein-glutamate O-methyltransferase CheR [Magnetococcales bacterium]
MDPRHTSHDHWLTAIINQVRTATRCDLGQYDPDLLRRRLAERIAEINRFGLRDYLDCLIENPEECQHLIKLMAVEVSAFFRNPIVFELIDQQVLPEIIDRKRRLGKKEVRVWSAGCCSGEEAYSIAMLIHDQVQGRTRGCACHIFATDIQPDTLEFARKGIYPGERLDTVKLGMFHRYFTEREGRYQVCDTIRGMVLFSHHDLTTPGNATPADSIFGTFDLILCRNVLIYFSPASQEMILRKFHDSLDEGGFLVLGEAEHIHQELESLFFPLDRHNRIYRKLQTHAPQP